MKVNKQRKKVTINDSVSPIMGNRKSKLKFRAKMRVEPNVNAMYKFRTQEEQGMTVLSLIIDYRKIWQLLFYLATWVLLKK
jgi:hypothetical protein